MLYSISEEGPYSEDVPKATEAGNYTVWYKINAGANYADEPARMIECSIKQAPATVTAKDQTVDLNGEIQQGIEYVTVESLVII